MGRKYVFIDRDGVINKDPAGWTEYGYVTTPEDFRVIEGVPEAIKIFTDAGYGCVIISNQQGVGKGYFSQEELRKVTEKMNSIIEDAGGKIEKAYYCTHTREEKCPCRKPRTGLFLKARQDLGIEDLDGKFYIGDTERDILAGKNAGLKTVLVLSGKDTKRDAEDWKEKPDYISKDLREAAELIVKGAYV
ncbi:MAG: HAD family hydrolase [Candidatus Omnitrophota bacterium]